MKGDVFLDEARNPIVTMVVAILKPKLQSLPGFFTGHLEVVGSQLLIA
jgi:hypothetical protein